jgi:zinc protease
MSARSTSRSGKTGFAHLFEHLMFNGSENAPGDFFEPLKQVGATDFNGTTSFDRTNYFETVPRPALDRALFLESDRMGYLTGAITQDVLDEQRGVVQNEKRQGDNQPYGLVYYKLLEELLAGNPYGHNADRLDGRSRCRQPRRRQELVPLALRPEQCGAGARRRCRREGSASAGREIFRRDPAGPKSVLPKVACRRCRNPRR